MEGSSGLSVSQRNFAKGASVSTGARISFTGVRPTKWRRQMSKKAAEHHRKAAEHSSHATHHHNEAAKHHEAGNHEKAGHHAHSATGHGFT
jgi:hypothetical protein